MRLIRFYIMIIACAGFAACSNPSATTPQQGSTFYFYPKPNVYYDVERKTYYLFEPSKGAWERRETLDAASLAALGKKVVIDTPGVPVYKDNEQHRLIYSATLYASQEEMRRKFEEDSINSLPKQNPTTDTLPTTPQEEKHKTKVGKFLDKLFGKKKK